MKLNEAQQIATRIQDIWPRGGIATHIWEEILQADYSDPERARRAIEKLKRTAAFINVEAFHHAFIAQPPTDIGHEPDQCTDCGDDGWLTAPDETHNQIVYTAVKPCGHCRHGRKAEHSTTWKHRTHQPDQDSAT